MGQSGESSAGRLTTHVLDTATGLPAGGGMVAGTYQLVFAAGDYFRAQGLVLAEPLLLDLVPLRFGISEPDRH